MLTSPQGDLMETVLVRVTDPERTPPRKEWTLVRAGETSYQLASHKYWLLVRLFAVVALAIVILGVIVGNEIEAPPAPAQLDARCVTGCYLRLR